MKAESNNGTFASWVGRLLLAGACSTAASALQATTGAEGATGVPVGRWASSDNVATTDPAKVGAKFFLDMVVAGDGSFKGTWEQYVCFNYPGPYGIVTVACQRARQAQAASGRLDAVSGTGQIDMKGLGKSAFRFKATTNQKGQPQLDIELPRNWQDPRTPVLYETSLFPR